MYYRKTKNMLKKNWHRLKSQEMSWDLWGGSLITSWICLQVIFLIIRQRSSIILVMLTNHQKVLQSLEVWYVLPHFFFYEVLFFVWWGCIILFNNVLNAIYRSSLVGDYLSIFFFDVRNCLLNMHQFFVLTWARVCDSHSRRNLAIIWSVEQIRHEL